MDHIPQVLTLRDLLPQKKLAEIEVIKEKEERKLTLHIQEVILEANRMEKMNVNHLLMAVENMKEREKDIEDQGHQDQDIEERQVETIQQRKKIMVSLILIHVFQYKLILPSFLTIQPNFYNPNFYNLNFFNLNHFQPSIQLQPQPLCQVNYSNSLNKIYYTSTSMYSAKADFTSNFVSKEVYSVYLG